MKYTFSVSPFIYKNGNKLARSSTDVMPHTYSPSDSPKVLHPVLRNIPASIIDRRVYAAIVKADVVLLSL